MAEKRHGNEAATRTTLDAGPIKPNNVSRNFVLLTKAGKQRHAAKAQEMIRDAKAASLPTMPLLDETIERLNNAYADIIKIQEVHTPVKRS